MATDAQRGEVLVQSHTAREWQLGSELGLLDSEVLSWGCGGVPRGYRGAITPVAQGCIPPWKGRKTGGRGAVREGFSKGARETVGILVDGIPRPYTGTQECASYLSFKSLLPFPMVTLWVSLMAQVVKNPPANTGNKGLIPDLEDPLEEEMSTHSSILVWEIPWTEEPDGLQSIGLQKSGHD